MRSSRQRRHAEHPIDDGRDPPTPDAVRTAAYIDALNSIDPDIVNGKPDRAIDRGRNQCSSIKDHPNDENRLIASATMRFSAPGHPHGFDRLTVVQILDAVRNHLCPS